MSEENEKLARKIMKKMQRIEDDMAELHEMLSQVATICKDAGLLEDDKPFVPFSGGGDKPPRPPGG